MTALIQLHRRVAPLNTSSSAPFIVRITSARETAPDDRPLSAFLSSAKDDELPSGFRAYLVREATAQAPPDTYLLPQELLYLSDGDIVRIDPRRAHVHTLYRRRSNANAFLVTEQCDNYCVMCSQPPREAKDEWLVDELLELLPLVDPSTPEIGLTGGEPGLLGPRLCQLISAFRDQLPSTSLHILTNGRAFSDPIFASQVGAIAHPDLMLGIPLYSDIPEEHDFVVQARGAFDQTIHGILNLKAAGVAVELRVVVHRLTFERLPDLAQFIGRNLTFADHVALMGLELMGFARTNADALWIDPVDYARELQAAVDTLSRFGIPTSIYNHQLCVLPERLRAYSRRSISDWKNTYAPECAPCARRLECGGFFASSVVRKSRGISPFEGVEP